jgi:hypothetical protein
LNAAQQQKASSEPISVEAILPSFARSGESGVLIKLPAGGGNLLPDEVILRLRVRVNISKPPSMEGKYKVIIEDLDAKLDVYAPISFRGSSQARAAYKGATHHLVLEVKEEDLSISGGTRPLRYYLPKGAEEIEIIQPVDEAVRFRLERIVDE